MTFNDPFASAPAEAPQDSSQESPFTPDPEPAPAQQTVVKTPAAAASGEGKVVLTFKGGTGYDAPWIVIHAESLDDAAAYLSAENSPAFLDLMTRVQKAGQHFASQGKSSAPASQGQARSNAPQGATQPPAGTPAAPGPDWVYKTGVGKTGKTWQAWMPPKGSPDHVKPVWIN